MRIAAKPTTTATTKPAPLEPLETVDGDVRPRAPDVEAEPTSYAPIASGADIAAKRPALEGVATKNVLTVRGDVAFGVATEGALDGAKALQKRLDEIEKMTKAGVRVRCVFDLDNTIFDTRFRTLFVAQEFARAHPECASFFDGVTAEMMKVDGRETAIALGAPNDVVEQFASFWDVEFWNPANLERDQPIASMVDLVNECKKRGADICFLTGRADNFVHPRAPERGAQSFRAATHAQLEKAGVDVDDDALALKPGLGVWTPQYKQGQLMAWEHDSEIGVFVTEGRRDLDFLKSQITGLAAFRLASTFEDGGPAVPKIPVLPGVM